MIDVDDEKIRRIGEVLLDTNKPLKARFRALFSLRNVPGLLSISYISKAFSDSSALLKHELAYCLGQMQDKKAVPLLCDILQDVNQEPIVRHEAAEALGAIGDEEAVELLEKYSKDNIREIAETCILALRRMEWARSGEASQDRSPYNSIDPAPSSSETDLFKLDQILLNPSLSLFERYKAMFALRNLGSDESALVLTKGLKTESALFSHEVAFVLGQMQKEVTVPALIDCLSDKSQNEMVRHECAEALGAIASRECFEILKKYLNDDKRVVRESCEIALDMGEYEVSRGVREAMRDFHIAQSSPILSNLL
ncbi:UNVERIFIED_CONTAM: hypothetical protein PYX00_005189 [Menopon gallinae]|uniref:Deoxyhypusine hydroxylase n=1 Tax=Menopon gallinae TaxID=328185 RepID=A0AAW2HRJ8_9NEOP